MLRCDGKRERLALPRENLLIVAPEPRDVYDAGLYSWWDYRAAAFRRNMGFRIDHILLTPPLAERCTAVHLERELRRQPKPSDHIPVVATFADQT